MATTQQSMTPVMKQRYQPKGRVTGQIGPARSPRSSSTAQTLQKAMDRLQGQGRQMPYKPTKLKRLKPSDWQKAKPYGRIT